MFKKYSSIVPSNLLGKILCNNVEIPTEMVVFIYRCDIKMQNFFQMIGWDFFTVK
jgi:hypothetical protein